MTQLQEIAGYLRNSGNGADAVMVLDAEQQRDDLMVALDKVLDTIEQRHWGTSAESALCLLERIKEYKKRCDSEQTSED